MVARPERPSPTLRPLRGDAREDRAGARADLEARARLYLQMLGRPDHPDAEGDPIGALFQVAIDLRCTADGYRALYLDRSGLCG